MSYELSTTPPSILFTGPAGMGEPKPTTVNPEPVIPDVTDPVVHNFVPAVGSYISSSQPISFDVTDDSGKFRRIIVHVAFADGTEEVAHNGESFRGYYSTTSTRVLITNGWRYTVMRSGGWPSTPTFNVFAIDVEGNEAA